MYTYVLLGSQNSKIIKLFIKLCVCTHCIPYHPLYFLLLNENSPFLGGFSINMLLQSILKYFKELCCFHLQMAACPFKQWGLTGVGLWAKQLVLMS